MSSATLRPCLKHQEWQLPVPTALSPFPFASSPMPSTHVHFPPTPRLTSTHLTHSPHIYDRAPISVPVNECALPQRNERTYYSYSPTTGDKPRRARRACTPHTHSQPMPASDGYFPPVPPSTSSSSRSSACPILVPDQSSESDESDIVMTPPEVSHMVPPQSARIDEGRARAFLPHPPSPPDNRGRDRERKRHSSARRPQLCRSSVTFGQDLELDGCLGGF